VPQVATTLSGRDHLGTIGARSGFARNNYTITPGLYCIGEADKNAPVLVTANYKLTFDALRRELVGQNLWLLVIDTRGINVWCAGGKGTFSAEEIAYQVKRAQLDLVVDHRQLQLPQLSANGVALHDLKNLCGFRGRFGPILASDIPEWLRTGETSEQMRTVTFTLRERAVLIPLEICLIWKKLGIATLIFFLLSGISPAIFSTDLALDRGSLLFLATLAAILAGAVATPLFLPWLPFRQFWLKGAVMGSVSALLLFAGLFQGKGSEMIALFFWISGCSSFMAMNFTGSTPFTSLSGVAKEMRHGLAFQMGSTVLALLFWVAGPFV